MRAKELGTALSSTQVTQPDDINITQMNAGPTLTTPMSPNPIPSLASSSPPPSPTASPLPVPAPEITDIPPKRRAFRTLTILIALYLTLFVAALDQTIIATAIPTITSSLKSASGYTWIGGAYLIANAAAGPIWTKLSDIWGRKPLLLGAVLWFFGASIVCAEAKSMKMLIIGRALQGVAGGGILGLVTVIISDLFSMRRRALWLGMLEVMWALAGGAGPILGGLFAEKLSWRWIFWINLPVCGTTFVLLLVFLDVHNPRTRMWDGMKAIDWTGCLSILAVTLMLLLGLDFGGKSFPWDSPKVICLLVFGSVAVILFIWNEKKVAKYPLMPLLLFRNRTNNAALLVTFAHGIVFIAGEYYLPLYIQSTHGATPIRSGVLILPLNITEAISGLICGVVTHQWHAQKELIVVGAGLMLLGTGLYVHMDASTPLVHLVVFQVIAGFGIGNLFNPPVIVIQNETPQEHVATATSTQAFIRNMATAIGVVLGGVIFEHSMSARAMALRQVGLPGGLLEKFSGRNAAANVGMVKTIHDVTQAQVVKNAFAWSIRNMFIFYTCVAAIGVVASFFIRKSKLSSEHIETRTGLLAMEKVPQGIELPTRPAHSLS